MAIGIDQPVGPEEGSSSEPAPAIEWEGRLLSGLARVLLATVCVLLVAHWRPPLTVPLPELPADVARLLPPAERLHAMAAEAAWLLALALGAGIVGWWGVPGARSRWWLQPVRLALVIGIVVGLLLVRRSSPPGITLAAGAAVLTGWGFLLASCLQRGPGRGLGFLALTGLLVSGSVAIIAFKGTSAEPTVATMPTPTAADRERWRSMLDGARGQPQQEPVRVELTRDDLNLMAASWLAASDSQMATDFEFRDRAELRSRLTHPIHVPVLGDRFVNVTVQVEPAVADQQLSLELSRFKVGSLALPERLMRPASLAIASLLNDDADLRRSLQSVNSIAVANERVVVSADPQRATMAIASAFNGDHAAAPELTTRVRFYLSEMISRAAELPEGDERFLGLVRTAFEIARERSQPETAAVENQCALVALGIQLGDPRVRRLAGFPPEEKIPMFRYPFDRKVTVRERNDLARHFFVSAALRSVSSHELSFAIGLIKEQLDAADGGSGFSFADLAADAAGVQFAHIATSDKSAVRLQERLSEPFAVADLMPEVEGLPENLSQAEFAEQYGGLMDPRFLAMTVEIQRRLSACEILGVPAPKSAQPAR